MVQSLLGLYPCAPLGLLLVDPHLPDWLPEITVRGLRVGKATVTLRFFRKGESTEATDYEILDQRGSLHMLRQPSPWSLTATFAERLKDVLTSFLPGRWARWYNHVEGGKVPWRQYPGTVETGSHGGETRCTSACVSKDRSRLRRDLTPPTGRGGATTKA